MSFQTVKGHRYAHGRVGKGERLSVPLPGCKTDEDAAKRAVLVVSTARRLISAGRRDRVKDLCAELGKATTSARVAKIVQAVDHVLTEPSSTMTFGKLAEEWTTGALAKRYPDHVRDKRSKRDDLSKLKNYILPAVENVPLDVFSLDHAMAVMREVPSDRSASTRRHVAQIMHRLLNLAVFPLRVIKANPLPRGFLPKLPAPKAKPFVYPKEEAALIKCDAIPLERRLVWGILAREGLRIGELLALEWAGIDLEHGVLALDKNKTDDPRSWALEPSVLRTLKRWRKRNPDRIKVIDATDLDIGHAADRLRRDLETAGVTRSALTTSNASRVQIRAHHLRGSFVTLSLANGQTESWVRRRTGHRSTLMISRYETAAATAAELNLGWFKPLDVLLGWSNNGQTAKRMKQ